MPYDLHSCGLSRLVAINYVIDAICGDEKCIHINHKQFDYKIFKTSGCCLMAGLYILRNDILVLYISSGYSLFTRRYIHTLNDNDVVVNNLLNHLAIKRINEK